MLPVDLKHVRTLLELMESQRGRLWWREHGDTIRVAFDLTSGSRSQTALRRYMRAKMNSAIGPERNLEQPEAIL